MMSIPIIRIALALIAVFAWSCGKDPSPTQAGSETTSGVEIASQGATIRGTTAPGAKVSIFDERYILNDTPRVVADSAIADDSGHVAFSDLPLGKYNVFVYTPGSLLGASALGIPVVENSPSTYADTAKFASLRTVTGTVTKNGQPVSLSQVFIAGSPYHSKTDVQGVFSFSDVPAGDYSIKVRELNKSGYTVDSVSVSVPENGNSVVTVDWEL
jgi:hypothetical protein